MSDRCLCSHPRSRHSGVGNCWSVVCGCREFRREPAPAPTADEQAVIDRFGIYGLEEAEL